MTGFLVLAALLAIAAALFVVRPWIGGMRGAPARARVLPVALAVVAIAACAALYAQLSSWPWRSPPPQNAASAAVATLLKTTREQPSDVQAWLRLGQAYLQIEQFPLARRAFERANQLASGSNAAALSGLAETVVLSGDTANNARAAELFERALQIDPQSAKALFYTALSAMQSGNLQLARDRFTTMRNLDAPAEIRAALDRQISALDEQLQGPAAAAAAGSEIRVQVEIDPSVPVPEGAVLFVFARGAGGGPPLAAKRLPARFPQQLTLSAADAMIAGNAIQAGQTVRIVARLSASGSPTAQDGDPAAEASAVAGRAHPVTLRIQR